MGSTHAVAVRPDPICVHLRAGYKEVNAALEIEHALPCEGLAVDDVSEELETLQVTALLTRFGEDQVRFR